MLVFLLGASCGSGEPEAGPVAPPSEEEEGDAFADCVTEFTKDCVGNPVDEVYWPFEEWDMLVDVRSPGFWEVEGGLISCGYEWQGPVTGIQSLAEGAVRSGEACGVRWHDRGFVSTGSRIAAYAEEDWDEPRLWYQDLDGYPALSLSTGDLNGDGVEDIAYSSYWDWYEKDYGRVRIFDGTGTGLVEPMAQLNPRHTEEQFGRRPVLPGDLDGDGLEDVVVEAGGLGPVYVFLGPVEGELSAAEADYSADWEMMQGVSNARDLDGDGLAELVVWENAPIFFAEVGPEGLVVSDQLPRFEGALFHDIDILTTDSGTNQIVLETNEGVLWFTEPGYGPGVVDYAHASGRYLPLPDDFRMGMMTATDLDGDGHQTLTVGAGWGYGLAPHEMEGIIFVHDDLMAD